MVGAPVSKVVPVDGGEDDIAESPPLECLGRVLRLVRVQWRWCFRCLDGAEPASPRARIAHEHDRGCSGGFLRAAPAVADVGTSCLFAHGVEVQASEVSFDGFVVFIVGDGGLEPGWEAGYRFLLPAGFADDGCADLGASVFGV